ncbi:MAG: exodeoxyribonuclease VII large subunit [Deltaproteobacteria bacterium]
MESYSLLKVNEYIKQVISLNFEECIWVDAEIAQVKEVRGQIYIELIEKSQHSENILAKAQAVIWFKSVLFIKKKLAELSDSILSEGMQIRFKARIEFHEVYGLKFSIEDIEPSFTLGQLEIKRQNTIKKLEAENLLFKNKETKIPAAIKNIAVISSEKAAGLQDFNKHIEENIYGYRFFIKLFDSSMQGNNVEKELLQNLNKINENINDFDCVVIIRGGGSKMDLSYFDNYDICAAVANFRLPVFTGIGHDIDKNVIELVVHSALKTPTAVADFIVQHNALYETEILSFFNTIRQNSVHILNNKSNELKLVQPKIYNSCLQIIIISSHSIEMIQNGIKNLCEIQINNEKSKLNEKSGVINFLDPDNILKRGYSYSTLNGKTIRKVIEVKKNDIIRTHLNDGSFESKII